MANVYRDTPAHKCLKREILWARYSLWNITAACHLERFWFRTSVWEVWGALASSAKCIRRILALSSRVLFLRWPCRSGSLSSLLFQVISCGELCHDIITRRSITWLSCLSNLLVSSLCHASLGWSLKFPHSLAALSRCSLSWLMLLPPVLWGSCFDYLSSSVSTFSPSFHLTFYGEFLQERNILHTGYRLVSCWLLEDAMS